MLRRLIIVLLAGSIAGCAHNATPANPHDPWEPTNRRAFEANEALDRRLLKPLADGYVRITPRPVRTGVSNFFDNATYPSVVVNSLLQGKLGQGTRDAGRLLINTTLGLGGVLDVATPLGLEQNDEDFGQTFAVWGFDSGPYLMLPALGPYTVRHALDLPLALALNPLFHLLHYSVSLPLTGLYIVNLRAELEPAMRLREQAAIDPYLFTRSAYLQHRQNLIYDGSPPLADDYDEWFD